MNDRGIGIDSWYEQEDLHIVYSDPRARPAVHPMGKQGAFLGGNVAGK
jgi:hypothetical protein